MAQRTYFSGGYAYSVYICNTKKIQSWGDNYYGQLARSTSSDNALTPGEAPNIENIVSIDAGLGAVCCALTSAGNVLTWGHNFSGELGIGKDCPGICQTNEADTVLGGETGTHYLENVVAISVGQMHIYALLASGEVVAWGNNDYGQLGDGTTTSKNEPVYVKQNESTRLSDITMIAAGGNHGYALTSEGNVFAWGDNQANQLGCGDSENHYYPQLVIDKNKNPITNIEQIDGGRLFGLMLQRNKMVYGVGAYKGTHIDKNGIHYRTLTYAENVTGGETPTYYLENVEAVSAGFSHAMALVNENGTKRVVSWGDNRFDDLSQSTGGQIGNGNITTNQFYAPVYMKTSSTSIISGVVRISAGCGVSYVETFNENTNENLFYICGCNTNGQLGLNDKSDRYYLTKVRNICEPYCGSYSLGKNKTLCTPIYYELQTPFPTTQFSINWFKNNILTDNTSSIYTVTDTGTYRIHIADLSGDCPDIESEVTFTAKEPKFNMLHTSFCGSDIEFKVVGDGTFNWYKTYNGEKIGSGNTLTASKSDCEELFINQRYQVWVEQENECQPIPFQSVRNCSCDIPAPPKIDTAFCYNKKTDIQISGDSIVWYADELCKNPILLNNTISINHNEIDIITLYTTSISGRCESEASEVKIFTYYCEPWYTVSGNVVDDSGQQIANAKVFLFCNEYPTAVDSCTTDENGEFTLTTQYCLGKILVTSLVSPYEETWAGNTIKEQSAYNFEIDATIKHLTITLQSSKSAIESLLPQSIWENGDKAHIYTIEGRKIDSFEIENKPFSYLHTYSIPILVVVFDKAGKSYSFVSIK